MENEPSPELAIMAGKLLAPYRQSICDLTAGSGQLAVGVSDRDTEHVLLIERDRVNNVKVERPANNPLHLHRLTAGELSRVYPLLRQAGFQCDCFTVHAPEEQWESAPFAALKESLLPAVRNAYARCGKTTEAAMLVMMVALDRMTMRGEGVMLASTALVDKLLLDCGVSDTENQKFSNLANHVWSVFVLGDITLVYFAAGHVRGCSNTKLIEGGIGALGRTLLQTNRNYHRSGNAVIQQYMSHAESPEIFDAVREEWRHVRDNQPRDDYHLWIDSDGLVQSKLSKFDLYHQDGRRVEGEKLALMNGKHPLELVQQMPTRMALKAAVESSRWRVAPDMAEIFAKALREYLAVRSPLSPLAEAQKLGFLDEATEVVCKKNFGNGKLLFEAGKKYPIAPTEVLVERFTRKPNVSGGMDEILLSGRELMLSVTAKDGNDYTFFDSRHINRDVTITQLGSAVPLRPNFPLQDMVEHFEMPDVPDVSVSNRESYEANKLAIDKIQAFIAARLDPTFKLKRLQREDLARAGVTPGCIFAWATGCGKSIGGVMYSLLRVGVDWKRSLLNRGLFPLKPVLFVAPENLHEQLKAEWKLRFGMKVTTLDSQETYLQLTNGGLRRLAPDFYVTSYTQLGLNKVKAMPEPDECERSFTEVAKLMHFYQVEMEEAKAYKATADDPPMEDGGNPLLHAAVGVCRYKFLHFGKGVGRWLSEVKREAAELDSKPYVPVRHDIKCIYSASLSDHCGHEFECVVIDEGTRIKGENTIIGRAVRELDPPLGRLVLTATPIKNRLKDIFWLIWWAAGGKDQAHARCPYTSDSSEQEHFAGEFNVCERNLTKEEEKRGGKDKPKRKSAKGKKKPRGKPGVEICNIHRLWKFIAPNVLRRRKEDFGEEIVKKLKHIVRVPLGSLQAQVYQYHLMGTYLASNGREAVIAQLTKLRQAAASPTSPDLTKLPTKQEGIIGGLFRSDRDYTPKMAATLNLIQERMRAGEQTVVFSAFHEPLDTLSSRLQAAGVPHDVLDGRKSGAWRGKMSADFGRGLPRAKPVLLGGLKAMAEGNNWPLARNVVVTSYDWAWDLYEQAINRIHRMNSPQDVNVWNVVTDGTIDRTLEALTDEKGESSDLVIDGKLIGQAVEEINFNELLKVAFAEFNDGKTRTYAEDRLETEWPELKRKLAEAYAICRQR